MIHDESILLCQNGRNDAGVTDNCRQPVSTGLCHAGPYTPDFNESDKSISVTLRNNDPKMPYLAQSWMEDEQGNKISSPLTVLPPVQRIDAMMNGQVKVQGMPDINKLPADRERVLLQRA